MSPLKQSLCLTLFQRGTRRTPMTPTKPSLLPTLFQRRTRRTTMTPKKPCLTPTLFQRRTTLPSSQAISSPHFISEAHSYDPQFNMTPQSIPPSSHLFIPHYFRGAYTVPPQRHLCVLLYFRGAQGAQTIPLQAITLPHFILEAHKAHKQ